METFWPPLNLSDFFLFSRLQERVEIHRDTSLFLFLLAFLPSGVVASGLCRRLGVALLSGLWFLFVCLVDGEWEVCVYELDLSRCMTPCVAPFGDLPYAKEITGHQEVLTLLAV